MLPIWCMKMNRPMTYSLLSGDARDQVAKLSEIASKLLCFWAAIFLSSDPKFLTQFYKSVSPSNMFKVW